MQACSNQLLYQNLQDFDFFSQDSLDQAFEESQEKQIPLEQLLLEKNLIADDNLGKVIADILRVPYITLSDRSFSEEALSVLTEEVAHEQLAIVYEVDDTQVWVATYMPNNLQLLEFIKKKTGKELQIAFATRNSILEAITKYQNASNEELEDFIQRYIKEAEGLDESKAAEAGAEPPIIKIVTAILENAYRRKTSDIHIEPEEEHSVVRFRIDGLLKDIFKMPKPIHNQVITRIKVLSRMRTDEHQAAQDGKLTFKYADGRVDARVSIVPTTNGEKAVIRVLSERSRQFSLADLGFEGSDHELVRQAAEQPHGMILATGPTGSGKTTTLYALIKLLNDRDINIMTIEDPVEYDLMGVNQIQVNTKTELTFAKGLRSIVRQDPDVVLVGEIRDEETANIAVNSAMTGHLVMSSLHTNDAATTFPRLADMSVEPFLIGSSVNVVIAQRLVRKLCNNCRISSEVNIADTYLNKQDSNLSQPSSSLSNQNVDYQILRKHFGDVETIRVYKGKGCDVCHGSGYRGRIGIFEVMKVTDEIREAIVAQEDASQIQKIAVSQGMTTMMDDGIEKVKSGETTLEEVLRVSKE